MAEEGDTSEGTGDEGTGGSASDGGTGGTGAAGKSGEKDWQSEAEKWKALSRKNESAAKRLQAIEDANKTELQKAQERADAAEKKAIAADLKAMRTEVGAEKKLPKSIAARLQGDTLEAMRADADAILKELGEGGSGGTGGAGGNGGAGKLRENLTSLLEDSAASNGKLPDMNAFMRAQRGGAGS